MANSNTFKSYNVGSININAISNENKINSLRSMIRLLDLDIVLLQEVECSRLYIPGFQVYTNVNETRRGTAIALKVHIPVANVQRSLDSRIMSIKINNSVTICNVYAPSGIQNYRSREDVFNQFIPYYLQSASPYVIFGGDFNCVIANKDATGVNNKSAALRTLIHNLNMRDTWDCLSRELEYSFIRSNCKSRLDRIYVSGNLVDHLRSASYHVNCFSDHKVYKLRLCLPDLGRDAGNGYWAMRGHVLTEENMEEFETKWNYWCRQKDTTTVGSSGGLVM